VIPFDTKPEIAAMQLQIRRAMTPEQRFRLALEISNYCREIRRAGIKRDHPDWSEKQVMIELFRLAFFPDPLPAWVR
jgi:Rv0078B-related antitoxin